MQVLRVSWNDYFNKLGFEKFKAHIDRERAGSKKDLRTTFYNDHGDNEGDTPREIILDSWGEILENSDEVSTKLMEFEHDMRNKVGPYSIVRPLGERMKDVESYFGNQNGEPIKAAAIELTRSFLRKMSGLSMINQNQVITTMDLSKSAGAPTMLKKKDVVGLTIPVDINNGNLIMPEGRFKICSVLGHRSQEGGISVDDVKNRIIFMFEFGANVLEQQTYRPLINSLKRHKYVPAYVNNDYVDYVVTKLFDTKISKQCIVSTDFEKFDQHFNKSLQICAQKLLFSMFQKTDGYIKWIRDVFPLKYSVPVAFNYDGDKILLGCGDHGMSSGSGGTNADETLAHMCLQRESALEAGTELNPYSMCLGDDGILSYPNIDIDKVVRSYSKHGLVMNTTKQGIDTDSCVYLRRFYETKYRVSGILHGIYSTYRAIGRLMATERSIPWTKELVALRQLSIIENVKWHPLREQFVQWCMKGDRYRLGLDIPGFLENLSEKVQEATRYIPDFIGYNKSIQYENDPSYGINKWWVVKYLKSIANRG